MTPANRPLPPGLELDLIKNIEIEQATLIVTVHASARIDDYPVDIQEVIPLSNDAELTAAVTTLNEVLKDRLRNPNMIDRETKCDHCNAVCCTQYTHVVVLERDVPALCEAVGAADLEELKKMKVVQGEPTFGQVGWLGRVKIENQEAEEILNSDHMCVFLTWNSKGQGRCGIYEYRPAVCRDYAELTCAMQSEKNELLYQIRTNAPRKGVNKIMKGKTFDTVKFLQHKPLELGNSDG